MIPQTARYYHPHITDRVAVISVQPADGAFLVRVARGSRSSSLGKVTTAGPSPEAHLATYFAEAEQSLRAEGYLPAGVHALLAALQSKTAAARARAAARLGWLRSRDAVPIMLAWLPDAVDDVCALIDALGAIGDDAAVPALRPFAARKLLSRRRSAVEALRILGDAEGLAEARTQALDRLPVAVRTALQPLDESKTEEQVVSTVVAAVLTAEVQQRGLAVDTLYELATPLTVAAAREALRKTSFDRPHVWRYVKSVLKRATLRHDYATFGELAHAIEVQARTSKGITATVKSGYDGTQHSTSIFKPNTQRFVRRSTWRFLLMLARHRPNAYAHAAAEVLAAYGPEDAQQPKGLYGSFASCYLLHRIAWGASQRFILDDRKLKYRFRSAKQVKASPDGREEAFPQLWDAQPRAFLRVLGASRLPEVQACMLASFLKSGKHGATLAAASLDEILALLPAPHLPTVTLGLEELERRFDPQKPDWSLLNRLLIDERPPARQVGQRFLRRSAELWTREPQRILAFLASPHVDVRALVVELAQPVLAKDAALRQALAPLLLAVLRTPEPAEGMYASHAQLAGESLRQELAALLNVAEMLDLVFHGSAAAQSVAAELLRNRPDAVRELGLERLVAMAQHSLAAVRSAAHNLLRGAGSLLRTDPAPLFVLVESDWADTRNLAFELLQTIDLAALGLEGLLGLLDSNRVDVQNLGQELTLKHFAGLPRDELVFRLAQHPHPNMRRFALDLVEKHLPDGPRPLAQLERFFRAALFDTWPQRKIKQRMIAFLLERGLRSAEQAEVAASILADVVRLHGRADFERALEALVRIKLAHPEVEASVNLRTGGEA